jgi:chaperonin GroEL
MPIPQVVGIPHASYQLKDGIDTIADLLAPTFGPVFGLVVNDREGRPELLEDSSTIVRRIIGLENPQREIGAMLLRNMIWNIGQRAGDGGAMAALLTRDLYGYALRLVAAGANAVLLSEGMQLASQAVVESLRKQARAAGNEDDLARMALALTHDHSMAQILGELSVMLGADGWLEVQEYTAPYLQRSYIAGARHKAQIASYHLYTQPALKKTVVGDALLALIDDDLNDAEELFPLLTVALESGMKSLAIMGNNFNETVLGFLTANQQALKDKLALVAFKLDSHAVERQTALEDLALLSGATLLGGRYERRPGRVRLEDLGKARRIEVREDSMILEAMSFTNPAVQEKVRSLRNMMAHLQPDEVEYPVVARRLATLTGGLGEMKIGAYSEHERQVKKRLAERAWKTMLAAQRGGVVAGGGAALLHCLPALETLNSMEGDLRLGVKIVEHALPAVFQQLLKNAHVVDRGAITEQVMKAGNGATFDVLSRQVVDSHHAGIADAADVLALVVQMSISTAIMALKTGTIVYHRKPRPKPDYAP